MALLDDDTRTVLDGVTRELLQAGRWAENALKRAEGADSAAVRARARNIRLVRERRTALRRLLGWTTRAEFDLERGLFLLSRLETPALDRRPYERALDAMARAVSERSELEQTDFSRLSVLPQYLGKELGFGGGGDDYHHPHNAFLHRAIEQKRGLPLTLTCLYLFVARRVGISAAAVPLPGHVLLRLYAGRRSLLVDPFHGGRITTRRDCVRYLTENGLVPRAEWFRDAKPEELFLRQVLNLMHSYQARGMRERGRELRTVAALMQRRVPRRRTQKRRG